MPLIRKHLGMVVYLIGAVFSNGGHVFSVQQVGADTLDWLLYLTMTGGDLFR